MSDLLELFSCSDLPAESVTSSASSLESCPSAVGSAQWLAEDMALVSAALRCEEVGSIGPGGPQPPPNPMAERWRDIIELDGGRLSGLRACQLPLGECQLCDDTQVDHVLFNRLRAVSFAGLLTLSHSGILRSQGVLRLREVRPLQVRRQLPLRAPFAARALSFAHFLSFSPSHTPPVVQVKL